MENKIYAEMKALKVVYVGERTGTAKGSGKPYSLKQVQLEQTTRTGMKHLHVMTVPSFNKGSLNIGDIIDADFCAKASGGVIYLDLTEHRVLSTEAKASLKSVAGGMK